MVALIILQGRSDVSSVLYRWLHLLVDWMGKETIFTQKITFRSLSDVTIESSSNVTFESLSNLVYIHVNTYH